MELLNHKNKINHQIIYLSKYSINNLFSKLNYKNSSKNEFRLNKLCISLGIVLPIWLNLKIMSSIQLNNFIALSFNDYYVKLYLT